MDIKLELLKESCNTIDFLKRKKFDSIIKAEEFIVLSGGKILKDEAFQFDFVFKNIVGSCCWDYEKEMYEYCCFEVYNDKNIEKLVFEIEEEL